tara:strand:- start:609 stop:749 length:141 start_codon:yes stop_codon:yes gene_type:complete
LQKACADGQEEGGFDGHLEIDMGRSSPEEARWRGGDGDGERDDENY